MSGLQLGAGSRVKERQACGWCLVAPGRRLLLLRNRQRTEWGVPKGHVEKGETEHDTAWRELEEETGLTADHVTPLPNWRRDLIYHPKNKKGKIYKKTTVLFLGTCTDTHPITLSDEHDDSNWATADDIGDLLIFDDMRGAALAALQHAS